MLVSLKYLFFLYYVTDQILNYHFQDVKCACDDGGLVHPWECCSEGTCNVFCCNCGEPCRANKSLGLDYFLPIIEEEISDQRVKRSAFYTFDPEEFNVSSHRKINNDSQKKGNPVQYATLYCPDFQSLNSHLNIVTIKKTLTKSCSL